MEPIETIHPKIRPPRLQVEEALNRLIEQLNPGDQLPPEPTLARQLGVSRATLREVMRTFSERGQLIRRHGVGTFISSNTPILESGLEMLESLDSLARRSGLETQLAWLNIEERPATPEELGGLQRPAESDLQILCVSRVISVANEPVAYLTDVVPQDYLQLDELKSHFHGSILDLFLERGAPMLAYSRTEIMAENASTPVANRLTLQRGQALIKLVAQLFSCDEKVVDYSLSYFVPGHFRFHVTRRVGK